MNRRSCISWLTILAIASALVGGCGTGTDLHGSNALLQARAGEWRGETNFGTFTFQVCPGGRKITSRVFNYEAGAVSATFLPETSQEIEIGEDGSFDLSLADKGIVFQGRFSEDNKRATGVWEMTLADAGTLRSEWSIER